LSSTLLLLLGLPLWRLSDRLKGKP
jgi:hypothetical protein